MKIRNNSIIFHRRTSYFFYIRWTFFLIMLSLDSGLNILSMIPLLILCRRIAEKIGLFPKKILLQLNEEGIIVSPNIVFLSGRKEIKWNKITNIKGYVLCIAKRGYKSIQIDRDVIGFEHDEQHLNNLTELIFFHDNTIKILKSELEVPLSEFFSHIRKYYHGSIHNNLFNFWSFDPITIPEPHLPHKKLEAWKGPEINNNSHVSIHEIIYGQIHEHVCIKSLSTNFEANYIPNSPDNAINPHFPSINIIVTDSIDYNAWLNVVYINDKPQKQIYSKEKDFYDAPHVDYTSSTKPIVWKKKRYAVFIDNEKQKVTCVGGIEWGFEINPTLSRYPTMLIPHGLSLNDWEIDWKIYLNSL